MVGEGPVQRQSQPLIGLFGLYTAIGSRMQSYARTPTNSFFFSFYLELHWAVFDSATGLLPLDLPAMEFADSINCEKTRIRCVARKDYATLL
jgi:hypothetical protein